MSKTLESLKELKHWKETNNEKGVVWLPLFVVEDIEKDLTELEQIKNANPSEAMDCSLKLYKMVESAGNDNGFNLNEAWKYHTTIKQALIKAQKQEKVFEIIKEKNVEMYWLKHSKTVEEYNKHIKNLRDTFKLTQEEFNTLKEYFKC